MGRGSGADSILYGRGHGFSQPTGTHRAWLRELEALQQRRRLRSEPVETLVLAQDALGEFRFSELVGEPVRDYYQGLLDELDDEELNDPTVIIGTLNNALSGVFEDATAQHASGEELDRLDTAVALVRSVFVGLRQDRRLVDRISAGDSDALLGILIDSFPASPDLPEFEQVISDKFASARRGWRDYSRSS